MKHAFSLVELSIVLVILGLLTGGILTGQNLIRAAELRSVVTEFQNYKSAVNTFRDKYFAIPGDMTNAEDFWGTMTNCGAASPSGTGTQTCNGDGDGEIDNPTAIAQTGETYTFWQQLANAELIEGSYTGYSGATTIANAEIGTNVPASKAGNMGWSVDGIYNLAGLIWPFRIDFGNSFIIGTDPGTGQQTRGAAFTPEETWNIDTKMDDGLPAHGNVVVDSSTALTTCTTAGGIETNLAATYMLTTSSKACSIRFIKAF